MVKKKQTAPKKFRFKMVGEDGNVFFLMGRFSSLARKAGWTQEEIEKVMEDARSGDYNHALQVLMAATDAY